MAAKDPAREANQGFEGEVTGLGLADIVQLNAVNRFSGCIEVRYEDRHGLVFLREGEVVHAEHGSLSGEPAFYEIISWPAGRFVLQENLATTRATIKKSASFLILEAHRLMDERRAAGPRAEAPRSAAPPPAPGKPASAAEVLERLRAIPGALYAVLQGKDGGRIGDASYEAEVLAGQALYLAMCGRRLSQAVQAGELHSAVVHGTDRHLLLLATKAHLIVLLAEGGAEVGAVELAMRKAIAGR
jgi:predicted regulator of Ras-like GTPase activity (Roadblock/LC7/MglB family)